MREQDEAIFENDRTGGRVICPGLCDLYRVNDGSVGGRVLSQGRYLRDHVLQF
jgi:hypothetical protein